MAKLLFSLESVEFQDGTLYQDLIKSVKALRTNAADCRLKTKAFFSSSSVRDICKVMNKHTGININMVDGSETGPAIWTPQLTGNHIFNDKELLEMIMEYNPKFDDSEHVTKLMKSLGTKVIKGEIDLKKARVSGAFSAMQLNMLMPKDMLVNKNMMSEEEVSAIMLHELGHGFTFMEFVSRTLTTNQSISALSRFLDKSVSNEKRVVIFDKAAGALALNKERAQALKECKSEAQLSVIILDTEIERSISELGYSVYDVNSCEYLADQFAARMGASRALVTGLDKIFKMYGQTSSGVFYGQMCLWVIMIITSVFSMGVALPLWIFVIIFGPSKESQIYDTPKARMIRIKLQNVEHLKRVDLDSADKARLIDEIEQIDTVMKSYDDNLTLIEKIAYVLRPGYRNAHKYELLQKNLEELASSDMFTAAAKLKMV